jgi:DNA-binding NarL/FixJ family response regulator
MVLKPLDEIRQLSPRSRILFLSQETSRDVIEAALGTGALGFVSKSSAAVELISGVEAVLRNEQFIRIA